MLPLLIAEYGVARQARWLRGGRASSFPARIGWARPRAELALLVPVLAGALRRATTLATSVAARGFDPAATRTFYPPLQLSFGERVAIAALAGSWLTICATKALYWLYLAELYYRPGLRGLYAFAREWL